MVVVIGGGELWPCLIACGAGSLIHLIKVRMNQPDMVVIGSATCVDVLEGREKEREQHPEARLYGRDTTHSVIDCTRADEATSKGDVSLPRGVPRTAGITWLGFRASAKIWRCVRLAAGSAKKYFVPILYRESAF
jgi:hypothetical protein